MSYISKLERFISEYETKTQAAMALGTSPRSLGRWLAEQHPIPERVKELLDENEEAEALADLDEEIAELEEEAVARRVLYSTVTFKGIEEYPLEVVGKSIEHREGEQFSRIVDERGYVVLFNLANVINLETELLSVDNEVVAEYIGKRQSLPANSVLVVTKENYFAPYFREVTLDEIIKLRAGILPLAEGEEDAFADAFFVIVSPEFADEI